MVSLLLAVCSFFLCANAMSFRKFSMSFAQQIMSFAQQISKSRDRPLIQLGVQAGWHRTIAKLC